MGYNLTKRISVLQKQADDEREGQWSFFRTLILAFFLLWILTTTLLPSGGYDTSVETQDGRRSDTWHADLERRFIDRLEWLERSPIVLLPGAPALYDSFAQSVVDSFQTQLPADSEELTVFDLGIVSAWLGRTISSALLRLGFMVIAFAPLWVIALISGYFVIRSSLFRRKPNSILGACDRGNGPFYSGIYGPLKTNNSFSGTDLSCPSLACPAMVKPNQAQHHRLGQLLREHAALNDTNLQLVRIILAHADFPAVVGEENAAEEQLMEQRESGERSSFTGLVAPGGITVEAHSIEGLTAVLQTHRRIIQYIHSLEEKGVKQAALNKGYSRHISNLKKLAQPLTPLGKRLLISLTPNRLWALAHVPPEVVATAYLATEAGKCLVFKRHGEGFTRISLYPHLQARAVVQSLVEYHREYDGDTRLIIRQAIICSRRHGDFGRAFLPNQMPLESRGIRDWLEILYADTERREEAAHLVELDAHIEEISVNWRLGFSNRLKKENDAAEKAGLLAPVWNRWAGFIHKSVVLLPVSDVVDMALKGIHNERQKRIGELLNLTRKYQMRISTSARLPGFRRQALEADKSGEDTDAVVQAVLAEPNGAAVVERWRIVRRMLTRYNWLSTRVGDDAVPLAGLIQGIYLPRNADGMRAPASGNTALVPLRQRRFVELLGKHWESLYYRSAPQPEEIEIFVNTHEYQTRLHELNTGTQRRNEQEGGDTSPAAIA